MLTRKGPASMLFGLTKALVQGLFFLENGQAFFA
jgi:hypothetical protein